MKLKAVSGIMLTLLLIGMLTLTFNTQPAKANPGFVTIKVQYKDGYPREGAHVFKVDPSPEIYLGTTNESGLVTSSGVLNPGSYVLRAFYPAGTQFGPDAGLFVSSDGSGYCLIRWSDYEITPPVIHVLSPQNQTYTNKSIPLTYTVYDYSPISWTGYSLDGQATTTITENTTLTDLSLGSHNIVVYSNDTFGNMGSSETVYFTRELGCVVIRVQYLDGTPRSNAYVLWRNTTVWEPFGTTNENGVAILSNYLAPGVYQASAWYPDLGTQFGEDAPFMVNETGDGSATIQEDYEITPPTIEVFSPQNLTYTNNSVPLTFTVDDYSPISWIGYSLDSQPNTTITGNTIMNVEEGSHYLAVYANDTFGNMGSSQIVYFTVRTGISDIAVTHIVGSKAVIGQNYSLFINVTVENQGEYTETFNVTLYANTTSIATQTITLTSGNSTTITFTWNTTGFVNGNYTISATADTVPGERDTTDNTLYNWIIITIPSDLNGDFTVDIYDAILLSSAFGSEPGSPNWNPNADINNDNTVDIFDAIILSANFGQTA